MSDTVYLLIFLAAIGVYVYGRYADYQKSVSRIENPEETKRYQDAQGRFDPAKFRAASILAGAGLIVAGLALYFLVMPEAVLIVAVILVIGGVLGIRASRS